MSNKEAIKLAFKDTLGVLIWVGYSGTLAGIIIQSGILEWLLNDVFGWDVPAKAVGFVGYTLGAIINTCSYFVKRVWVYKYGHEGV